MPAFKLPTRYFDFFYALLLSENTRRKSERLIVYIAVISFIAHLLLILAVDTGILWLARPTDLLKNPIAAIYTPFSFILIYEVYLLVYYLPKSTSIYIGKQYEIITLIVIRRIFKDLSKVEFTEDWFRVKEDLLFTYDLIATLLLFLLIFAFYRFNTSASSPPSEVASLPLATQRFIRLKNILAMVLVPVFLILAVYSLGNWVYENFLIEKPVEAGISDFNKIFFDEFFTVLIVTDVLLLLISFLHTDQFSRVIRNSGFIISTILIKLSFGVEGLLNTLFIVVAVAFGVLILGIHTLYDQLEKKAEKAAHP
ncbi:MAG: hypothetical protein OHK0053_34480 [Microscillaceae bacterium]